MMANIMFSIMYIANWKIEVSRFVYYIYMFQKSVKYLTMDFKFKIGTKGMSCRSLDSFINGLINSDQLSVIDNKICLTELGELYYDNMLGTAEELDFFHQLMVLLNSCTDAELKFLCYTDIMIEDMKRMYSPSEFGNQKPVLVNALKEVSTEYSNENLEAALKILRLVQEGDLSNNE